MVDVPVNSSDKLQQVHVCKLCRKLSILHRCSSCLVVHVPALMHRQFPVVFPDSWRVPRFVHPLNFEWVLAHFASLFGQLLTELSRGCLRTFFFSPRQPCRGLAGAGVAGSCTPG